MDKKEIIMDYVTKDGVVIENVERKDLWETEAETMAEFYKVLIRNSKKAR